MKKFSWPEKSDFRSVMAARHGGPEAQARLSAGKVAVAGLGGLGSHIAVALARAGVGRLLLADFDVVDLSNLGRQAYSLIHLGRKKTEALAEIIAAINPYLEIETLSLKLTAANIPELLRGWPIIIEAIDRAEGKAELVTTALAAFPEAKVICASGLAGLHSPNLIHSRRVADRWYLCGDEQSGVSEAESLMGARVMICAGHQATLALRLLLDKEEV